VGDVVNAVAEYLDRAGFMSIAIIQLIADRKLALAELRFRIAQYLRAELKTIEAEIAADRRGCDHDA
jgi:hypothetical protein